MKTEKNNKESFITKAVNTSDGRAAITIYTDIETANELSRLAKYAGVPILSTELPVEEILKYNDKENESSFSAKLLDFVINKNKNK